MNTPAFLDADPWRSAKRKARRPDMPGAAGLAEQIRDGATLDDLAEKYGRSRSQLKSIINRGGFSTVPPEPEPEPALAATFGPAGWMPDWYDDALCAQTDPEMFYPEKGGSTREAKKTCAACPVREACLEWALEQHERFGIWGGLSERERRKLDKARSAA